MARDYKLEDIRNIGIMAHIDAGKTTLTERILLYSGKIHKTGEVHEGKATTDFMVQEQERGITIQSACVSTSWADKKINIIDTPGHVDFTVEVERSLKVLDGAVTVLSAREGVQPQSETVWRQADKYKVPRMVFVNKMDINDANFYKAIGTLKTHLNANPVAVQIPVGAADTFTGVIDLVEMKYYKYNNILGKDGKLTGTTLEVCDIPAEMKAQADEYRAKMVEAAAEQDDILIEKYFSGEELTAEEIKAGLRKGTTNLKINPVTCGTALGFKAIPKLLDAICDYMPSPLDIPAIKGTNTNTGEEEERITSDDAPFAGLAFKVIEDQFGTLIFFRVYSGVLSSGSYVYNSTKDKKERIGRLVRMFADERQEISEIRAGDIAAIVGLKDTVTADTLCDEKNPIILESMNFAEPVIKLAIEPKSKDKQEKMILALVKLSKEDPTFKTSSDKETGQTIIAGMGELHLDIMIDRLKREFGVEVNQGKPQVAYRETFKQTVNSEGKYIKQSGGKGQYGHCWLKLEPQEPGKGFTFADETVGGSIPKEYIPAVEKGLLEAKQSGILAGYETVDFKATVYDGSYHDVDSSEMAFKIAASMAFKDGVKKAQPILLEPITKVQVVLPEEYLGGVMGNLTVRRGQIGQIESQSGMQVINAEVPLSEMFGYVTDLRSNTQGRGTFTMEVIKYAEVPSYVADKIISDRSK